MTRNQKTNFTKTSEDFGELANPALVTSDAERKWKVSSPTVPQTPEQWWPIWYSGVLLGAPSTICRGGAQERGGCLGDCAEGSVSQSGAGVVEPRSGAGSSPEAAGFDFIETVVPAERSATPQGIKA